MNTNEIEKIAAIHRMAELNLVELKNMKDIREKKKNIIEDKLSELEYKFDLTDMQEFKIIDLQDQIDEMENSIDNLESVISALEELEYTTMWLM